MHVPAPPDSVSAAQPFPVSRVRIVVNRIIFRGMLFTMGSIAVAMSLVLRNENLVWRFAKAQARNLARLCGVRVRVRGSEHLRDEPYVFAPNHQSHFDIVALLGYLPGNNRFAAKRELFREPVLGLVLRRMGMIPIDRDDSASAIDRMNRASAAGTSAIIFPEGTRSPDGRLLPFKKGAFVTAIHAGVPIVPVVCKGTHDVMPKGGYLSILPGEVELVVLPPIATQGLTYDDREDLLERVRAAIARELTQVGQYSEATDEHR